MIKRSRPEVTLDAQDARPDVLVVDALARIDGVRARELKRARAASRTGGTGCPAAERRLDLRVHDFKADIEVRHRVPDRTRTDLPGVPIRTARGETTCHADQRV